MSLESLKEAHSKERFTRFSADYKRLFEKLNSYLYENNLYES
jgi:hypothetical protein